MIPVISLGHGIVPIKTRYKIKPHRGEANGSAKLTEEQVRTIIALKGTMTQDQVAAEYGINQSRVSRIWNRKAWRCVI